MGFFTTIFEGIERLKTTVKSAIIKMQTLFNKIMSHSTYPVAFGTVSMRRNVLPSRLLTHLLARLTAHMCRKHSFLSLNSYPSQLVSYSRTQCDFLSLKVKLILQ